MTYKKYCYCSCNLMKSLVCVVRQHRWYNSYYVNKCCIWIIKFLEFCIIRNSKF